MTVSIRRRMTFAGLGVAGAGALLAVALAGSNAALADPSASPSVSSSASAAPGKGRGQADREARQNELAEKLAKELGVDQEKVKAALEKIRTEEQAEAKTERLSALKERLDQAVKDGTLTQAEADAIYKAAENGVIAGGPGGLGGPGGGHRGGR
jgi:hypothetical protein